ncbi:hypothetical protein FQN55_001664 [Onygenales sp. PD_40]|nr:hypothetical protein FQN55_001664 [Onygenales sp. PD_40]KAK2798892.1 hypothetical protein FQN51_007254 [Onygenales sp. PD_10]
MAAATSLRAATHRLTATPVKELPLIAPYLATAFADCGSILSAPQSQKKAPGESENALLVQKLKARLTSLLQDKTVEGRWTAVILVKAVIEAGQWEILRGCEGWVRSLLGILGRPDPSSTKKLCLITLTRIFQLTYPYQTLVREITTPSLPSFITSCLNLVSVKQTSGPARQLKRSTPLLETVLHVFVELLPRHPTIFRPFSSQIHGLILPLVVSSFTPGSLSQAGSSLPQQLFISLHQCAPKNTGGEEWLKACRSTISSIHRTGDNLFRAVVEQWESVDTSLRQISKPRDYNRPVGDDGPDALGLPGWEGIYAGSERLECLLKLLILFVSMPTSSTVTIPLGSILDLSNRLVLVIAPSLDGANLNPQIGREEKESLWAELPKLHLATLELLHTIIERFGFSSVSISQSCLDQTLWTFEAENRNMTLRTRTYRIVAAVLPIIGPSMTKSGVSSLTSVVRSACQDLLPSTGNDIADTTQPSAGKQATKPNPTTSNVDTFLNRTTKHYQTPTPSFPALRAAATSLLPNILTFLPTESIPPTLRTEIDRTAIITKNEAIMIASVLHPVPVTPGRRSTPSIMPFLARSFPETAGVEALLRPRMPVLMGTATSSTEIELADVDEEFEARRTQSAFVVPVGGGMPEELTRPMNKRVYQDEQQPQQPTSFSPVQEQPVSQIKRARVEETQTFPSSSEPMAGVSTTPTMATVTSGTVAGENPAVTPISSILAQAASAPTTAMENVINTNTSVAVGSSAGLAVSGPSVATTGAGMGADDDSDDEIPTLNIEPDSDEDEDE